MIIDFDSPLGNIFPAKDFSLRGLSAEPDENKNNIVRKDSVELSSIAKELNKVLRDLRSAESVKEAQYNEKHLVYDKATGGHIIITPSDEEVDSLVSALEANAEEIPKPDGNIKDVHWGAMVRLGNAIGIDDGEVLASLTNEDMDLFYNEFVEKKGITDPSIKQFEDTDSFWKTVFKTDENGNFMKKNGRAVHNTDFEFKTIRKPDTGLTLTGLGGGPIYGDSIYGRFEQSSELDLTTDLLASPPESILRWGDAVINENDQMKWSAIATAPSGAKDIWEPDISDGETEEDDLRGQLSFYMFTTSTNFNDSYVKTADTDYVVNTFSFSE